MSILKKEKRVETALCLTFVIETIRLLNKELAWRLFQTYGIFATLKKNAFHSHID